MKIKNNYMPDVLDCLANLSNDEVFTPPLIANQMLDLLPQEIFESKETTFLDPFTKSGVFLREITKRLLEHQVPGYKMIAKEIEETTKTAIQDAVKNGELDLNDKDYENKARKIGDKAIKDSINAEKYLNFEEDLQEALNHILTKQVFGIAITELTAQLSRRSLYCSKDASGRYSIVGAVFGINEAGNIRFVPMKHNWDKININGTAKQGATCKDCGASASSLNRPNEFESHAYEFIHKDIEEIKKEYKNMEFTVICGNPPYQLQTAGSVESQAVPIYNKFIEQAKRLNPRYLTMIVPARWLNGGFGLDKFREIMLKESQISDMHIFMDSNECFPGVDISGGICYFLWDKNKHEKCNVYNHQNGKINVLSRPLLETGMNCFIRENNAVSIMSKVIAKHEESFMNLVTPADPFGLNYKEGNTVKMAKDFHHNTPSKDDVGVYYYGHQKDGIGYIDKSRITSNVDAVNKYKVLISKAYGERGAYPYFIIGKPFLAEPNTCCNMSYIMAGSYDTKEEAENVMSYMRTKFFRFLVSILKSTQNAYKKVYELVPMQDFSKTWTDEELYKKYNITKEEIDFIDSMIKPME